MSHRLRDCLVFVVGATAFTLLAFAGDPAVTAQKHSSATDYTLYMKPPVKRFVSFGLQGWEHVGQDQIVVWNGVNEAYLLALGGICPRLRWSQGIQVNFQSSSVSTFDTVRVGNEVCTIDEIRPLDIKRLKADRAAAAKLRKQQG